VLASLSALSAAYDQQRLSDSNASELPSRHTQKDALEAEKRLKHAVQELIAVNT